MLITMEDAAEQYGVAAVRIHALIRSGEIEKRVLWSQTPVVREVVVDTKELDLFFENNPGILKQWQDRFREAKADTEGVDGPAGECAEWNVAGDEAVRCGRGEEMAVISGKNGWSGVEVER